MEILDADGLDLASRGAPTVRLIAETRSSHERQHGPDGPAVADAPRALAPGNVNAALTWVRPQDEAEVREIFQEALQGRASRGRAG